VTGILIGGGVEYGIQVTETYQKTGDWTEALAWENKDKNKIYVGAIIGGISGGLTGGIGSAAASIQSLALRQTVKIGSSAIINAAASTSYVGAQAYFSEGATLQQAVDRSAEYLQENLRRDLTVGVVSSVVADLLSVTINSFVSSRFSPNPYYLPSPVYRRYGSAAGNPTSRYVGSTGLQGFRKIPAWYPATRAATNVIPVAFSNTDLWRTIINPLYQYSMQ
jgi:hypothetical protein